MEMEPKSTRELPARTTGGTTQPLQRPRQIVGVMPMAGNGSRSGLWFHKALAPTFGRNGEFPVPLWRHAYDRLAEIADPIIHVLSREGFADRCLDGIPGDLIVKPERGEAPSTVATAARDHPGAWLALAFPDSIWSGHWPALMDDLDGYLLCWHGDGAVMDQVIVSEHGFVDGIRQKSPDRAGQIILGWGAFVIRADIAATWRDDAGRLSDHLERIPRLRAVTMPGRYLDLGTPEAYADHLRGAP